MSHDPRFSIIPGWIVTDPRLKGRDLQVLCLLGRHTDKQGWCRRSQVKMAEQLACARSTVQASLDRLAEVGVVEKHQENNPDGRDSAHFYRVIYDRAPPAGYAFDAWREEDEEENIPISGGDDTVPPADISAPPADPEPAPPADPGSAPINAHNLTPPIERREREARERGFSGSGLPAGHVMNAELIKRVQKFCTGEGYREGQWPKWEKSTIGHIAKQFAGLTSAEQDDACEGRDPFLAKCRRDGVSTPMPVANYFRDHVWDMLKPADKAGPRGGESPTQKIAAPFGKAWGAARIRDLLGSMATLPGFDKFELLIIEKDPDKEQMIWRDKRLKHGWPSVVKMHEEASAGRGYAINAGAVALAEDFQQVLVGGELWEAWKHLHAVRGWPWLPDPGRQQWVWFPPIEDGARSLDDAVAAALERFRRKVEGNVSAAAE